MPEPTLTERQQSGAEGIRDALDIALEKNASVFLIGEGVADPKGIFGTTTGLIDKYGPSRHQSQKTGSRGLLLAPQ